MSGIDTELPNAQELNSPERYTRASMSVRILGVTPGTAAQSL
jgi:hypothetical protein